MTEYLDKQLREHTPEPLHQLLLSFGRNWLQRPGVKNQGPSARVREIRMDQRFDLGEQLITERARETTVTQLATSLRMQGLDDESTAMLGLLESLALAGEITFRDYISRVQNLFPRVLDQVDISLRVKVTALIVD